MSQKKKKTKQGIGAYKWCALNNVQVWYEYKSIKKVHISRLRKIQLDYEEFDTEKEAIMSVLNRL